MNDNRPSHLLPPNATRLERVLCDAFDTAGLSLLADAPRRLKTEPSPILLPWLASEWGLAGLVKYFPTLEDLIDAALPWLMERGTAAAVERALSWIGFDNVVIEEHGARLSLDLGRIPTAEELEDIVYLIVLSIPAHVDLYRLYHGYDLRPIGVSQPENLDEGLLDDDSGIWTTIDGEAVKLSFGMERAVQVNAGKGVFLYRRREDTAWSQTFYDDKFRLDVSAFGDEIVPNRLMTVEFLVGQQAGGINWHPPTLGRRINIARAALDFDDDVDVFGDLNHGFAGGVTVQRNPFMLSDSILDEHDYQIEHVFLDELFADDRGIRAVFDPRVRHPGARREDTAWSRTIYEDRFILSVSPFDGEVVPNRSLAAEFALSTRIGDVGGESYPLNGITIEANRGDAHLAPAIVVASLPSLPMSRLDAAAQAIGFWPGHAWRGGWDARAWDTGVPMTFGREDVRARRDALALDAIAIGAGHGETRAFASIAAMREARGQSHTRVSSLRLWSPEHPWRGAWDARPWTETHVWSRRADCAASRASASARLAAASARTHGFAAALPTPTIAGERREVHGNRLSLWHAPGWTSAWDSRRWRQTISVPSHITHTKE